MSRSPFDSTKKAEKKDGSAVSVSLVSTSLNKIVSGPQGPQGEKGDMGPAGGLLGAESIAELRSLIGQPKDTRSLRGHTTVDDGGGGLFVWDTAVATDDGGTVLNEGGLGSSSAGWRRVYSGHLDARWFGAVADGVTDQTTALARAWAAAITQKRSLHIPRVSGQSYALGPTIAGGFILNGAGTITSDGATIKLLANPGFVPATVGKGINVTSNDVIIDGLVFDSTGVTGGSTPEGGPSGQTINCNGYDRLHVRNCTFINLGPISTVDDSTNVCGGIWLQDSKGSSITDCDFGVVGDTTNHGPSGFGISIISCTSLNISKCRFNNVGWTNIHTDGYNSNIDIDDCSFYGNLTNTSNQGGRIEFRGASGNDTNLRVRGCYFEGLVTYGNAIRIGSARKVLIEGNHFGPLTGPSPTGPQTYIAVSVRDDTFGAWRNIIIKGNTFEAGQYNSSAGLQAAIYAQNISGGIHRCYDLTVSDNHFISPDANNYWGMCVFVHGQDAGVSHVSIHDNVMVGKSNASTFQEGLVSLIGNNSGGTVYDVQIHNNSLHFATLAGDGSPGTSAEKGIALNGFCDRVNIKDNKIRNFFTGIRTESGAGPILKGLRDRNDFVVCTNNVGLAVEEWGYAQTNVGSPFTSLSANSTAEFTFDSGTFPSLAGALTSHRVVCFPVNAGIAYPDAGISWCAYVSSSGNVKIRWANCTGSPVDIENFWAVRVEVP